MLRWCRDFEKGIGSLLRPLSKSTCGCVDDRLRGDRGSTGTVNVSNTLLVDDLARRIGERGVKLSGGQRQRLALARALHREPELLILDDLSSAVDADTELALWETMRTSGVTILAISNRPIAIAAADQVLAMDNGTLRRSR